MNHVSGISGLFCILSRLYDHPAKVRCIFVIFLADEKALIDILKTNFTTLTLEQGDILENVFLKLEYFLKTRNRYPERYLEIAALYFNSYDFYYRNKSRCCQGMYYDAYVNLDVDRVL